MKQCAIFNAGFISYADGLLLQKQAREKVQEGEWDGILLLLEHPPVITIGRAGGYDNLRGSPVKLSDIGVEIIYSNRGGNITCHNPGQLIGYPILNLKKWQTDIHWYIRTIEQLLIKSVGYFGINAETKPPLTGVWVKDKKIAAIGVAAGTWITYHGFALYVRNNFDLFENIIPCGIKEYGVVNMCNLTGIDVAISDVQKVIEQDFSNYFHCTLERISELGDNNEQ